jgi:hypothetical protein
MQKNTKTFKLVNRISKTFGVIIANFSYAATLLFRIRFKIPITFISRASIKAITIIRLRRVRLIISQVKLIVAPLQTINLRRVSLIIAFRQIVKESATILLRVPITFTMRTLEKLSATMKTGILSLLITALVVTFNTLGDFDPDTLGDLDAMTLQDMDYTEV